MSNWRVRLKKFYLANIGCLDDWKNNREIILLEKFIAQELKRAERKAVKVIKSTEYQSIKDAISDLKKEHE